MIFLKKWLSFALILCLVVGCGAGQNGMANPPKSKNVLSEMSGADAATAGAEAPSGTAVPAMPRKIIYTGDVNLNTDNLDVAAAKLEGIIKQFNGYLGSATRTGTKGSERSGTWTARIPSGKYGDFVKTVIALGELQSSTQNAEDVSEEFYDVAARLKNKKIEEQRLVELLQKATGKLSEVLQVEKEISRVRSEIEQIEGRLRFLTNQTDLSTVTITFNEVKEFRPAGPPSLKTDINRTFTESIGQLGDAARSILLMVVALIPWCIVPGLVIGFLLLRARKEKVVQSNDEKPD